MAAEQWQLEEWHALLVPPSRTTALADRELPEGDDEIAPSYWLLAASENLNTDDTDLTDQH